MSSPFKSPEKKVENPVMDNVSNRLSDIADKTMSFLEYVESMDEDKALGEFPKLLKVLGPLFKQLVVSHLSMRDLLELEEDSSLPDYPPSQKPEPTGFHPGEESNTLWKS